VQLKAVVFDFDGVLVDSAEAYLTVLSETVAPVKREDWPRLYGMTTAQAVEFAAQGTMPGARVEKLSTEIDRRVGDMLAHTPPARSGAGAFVQTLHAAGLALAVASSASRHAIDGTLGALGWNTYFRAIVGREDVRRSKPFPDVYAEAVRRLGVLPALALAVEDTHIGILAARGAGLQVVALGGTQPASDLSLADAYCEDFAGLAATHWLEILGTERGKR
jgi:HAD superfamily hydrolase (TIGR01509 family)